jgi:glucokinase
MQGEANVILGDLGGTHLRLAKWPKSGAPQTLKTYALNDWKSLSDVLADYAPDTQGAQLVLSFAKKYNPDGIYRFDRAYKNDAWEFSAADLKRVHGFSDVQVIHDFHAMALSLFWKTSDVFESIVPGIDTPRLRAVIGVGTGCGHALVDVHTNAVYDTFGGHFPPAAISAEQKAVLQKLEAGFSGGRTFIWEEILSGRGFHALQALADDAAPRLFCEFLGLYANTVCVGAHAFGGLYLTGGVIDRLMTAGHFDQAAFLKYFYLDMVKIVDEALRETPIFKAKSPDTALYGLAVYAKDAA